MPSTETFSRIRAAAIDGRLANPYFRRTQLENLHAAVISKSKSLRDVVVLDGGVTTLEAAVELQLALDTISTHYSSIDPEQDLGYENSILRGSDAAERRVAAGIVYIEPCVHTLLFSVLSPLSASIAAGNCVVIQVRYCSFQFGLRKNMLI
jgi:acyl-CoA reductase-like NAD-dependent aldehyde dehydrogenase